MSKPLMSKPLDPHTLRWVALWPCPFCRSGKTQTVEDDERPMIRVRCEDCQVEGPVAPFDSDATITAAVNEARRLWNTRAVQR